MYWEKLGFREPPFALTPNPEFLFMSSHHQEAFAHLLYAIDTRAGFIELSGEVGTGKTTIIRTLLGQLPPETHRTALIFNPVLSPPALMQEINREFGLPCSSQEPRDLLQALNDFLLEQNGLGRTVVLVIDEAQNLSLQLLEQIRLISNLETDKAKLIQIVLVGQPELKRLLARDELRQLSQRITVRYHLEPMERSDIHAYIRHRIMVAAAGSEPVTFTPGAVKKVSRFSGGLPRLINALCDRALLLAYTRESRVITPAMAAASIADLVKERQTRSFTLRQAVSALLLIACMATAAALYLPHRDNPPDKVMAAPAPVPVDTANIGVKSLQLLLGKTGHYAGTPDGIFDSRTEEGVRRFQQAEKLAVDGKPGGRTLTRLYQRAGGIVPNSALPAPLPAAASSADATGNTAPAGGGSR